MLTTLLFACHPELFPPDQAELNVTVREYTDPSRQTPALGSAVAADVRALPTRVWVGPALGTEAPSRPLLLMLHGLDGHPDKFEQFARALAEWIVVAAPAFPVSNRDAGGGAASITDLPQQVIDTHFVIQQLISDVSDEDGPLWARFDPDRIVALGHSMGGVTLLGDARFGEGEPRLTGQIYVAAAMQLEMLLEGEVSLGGPPTLVMQGLEDDLVPPAFSVDLFTELSEPKWYIGIAGAGHSEALESQDTPPPVSQEVALSAVRAMIDVAAYEQPNALDHLLEDLATDGHTTE